MHIRVCNRHVPTKNAVIFLSLIFFSSIQASDFIFKVQYLALTIKRDLNTSPSVNLWNAIFVHNQKAWNSSAKLSILPL